MPRQGSRITVAHIVPNLDVGGLERVVVDLVNGIDREAFRVLVYTLGDGGPLLAGVDDDLARESFNKRDGRDYSLALRLVTRIRSQRVDVLHCHNVAPVVYGGIGSRLVTGARIVFTAHGPNNASSSKIRLFRRLRLLDEVVTVSEEARERALAVGGLSPHEVVAIHNGIDLEPYQTSAERGTVRRELGIRDDAPVFGIVARLAPVKRHTMLFDAFKQVLDGSPDARLVVVGDGPLRDELHARVGKLGLGESVHLVGNRDDVPALLSAFDYFALCSRNEGLSISLIEAMASGLPIVATDVGGNSEVVLHEKTGLTIPTENVGALADAMRWMVSNRETAVEMGRVGRQRALDEFAQQTMVRRYETMYRGLVNGR